MRAGGLGYFYTLGVLQEMYNQVYRLYPNRPPFHGGRESDEREPFHPLPDRKVRLLPGLFKKRYDINRRYMLSLATENLLQNHYLEAGLVGPDEQARRCALGLGVAHLPDPRGVPGPLAFRRLPHLIASTGDPEIKGKADFIVSEVARCQAENGGEWAGPIPEKYMDWLARGKKVWAPHCTVHRNMMGLV